MRIDNVIIPVFHGSSKMITPEFGLGSFNADYGQGFYTTPDIKQGRAWSTLYGNEKAVNNKYELDTTGLNVLYLDDYGPLAWVAELMYNRNMSIDEKLTEIKNDFIQKYKVDTSNADIIVGYRAGGAYMQVCESFLKGQINIDEVERLFKDENLGLQIFLKSKQAFCQITKTSHEVVIKTAEYEQTHAKAETRSQNFLNKRKEQIERNHFIPNGILIKDACEIKFDYDLDFCCLQKDTTWIEYEELKKLEKELAELEELEHLNILDSFQITMEDITDESIPSLS